MNTNRREASNGSTISRRNFLATTGLAATAAWLAPLRLFAQEEGGVVPGMRRDAGLAKITVETLRGNVSVLMGSGGNIGVLAGRDGKVLVDAGITGSRPRITEALARISPEPVKVVINTHWHFDHTDGNEWLHSTGATIVAHENTLKHLSKSTRVEDWKYTFAPSPAGALPTTLVKTDRSLRLGNATLALNYYGPCHTDSDLSVYFADADILQVGDVWWNGHYPFIDYSTGGSIGGTIRATEATLARVTDKTLIIPGHGPVGNRSALTEYRDMLSTVQDKVAALKKQGLSLAEVITAKPTAAYDAKWGGFVINGETFTGLVYKGV